ncbi:protein STRUBBELIG-RECEPTOR FAMILY 7 isoform X2 [Brachypodium distachyon]|uniref:protein STRUBBELIG-RECEPTOR FAMILY 7 isoform X2 n=1 Tax=Brachypodium distachyon TaxID=15368 RepID=UPI000D0DD1E1|nr:protein STRUBBELIG-RECEPTOR FAMILY 7 isoform X2 [Brachypodium distachyon]|eukprot:XP_024313475.1 protein STRUBBELIG-RECEPTOR FAMILY 7 isoform X2 [Brachypodium distachyon]
MLAFFVIKWKSMRRQHGEDLEKNVPLTHLASGKFKPGKEGLQRTVSMNLKPPSKIGFHKSSDENDHLNKSAETNKTNMSSIRATAYTVADLQMATESFSTNNLIGEGTFGRVYRGQLSNQKVLTLDAAELRRPKSVA